MVVLVDLVLVVVFCVIGRLSHAEGVFGDMPGTLNTIWPFVVAALVAHAVLLARRARSERLLPGLLVWMVAVVVGLLLRAVSGQGTALPFIIVAALTLALFLLGWRAVLVLVRRLSRPVPAEPRGRGGRSPRHPG